MKKKLLSVFVVLSLCLSLPALAVRPQEDPGSCRFTVTSCDHSRTLSDGTPSVDCSYDLVQVSGVPGADSINQVLWNDYVGFDRQIVPEEPVPEEERLLLPYLNLHQAEITSNDRGIFSLLMHYSWYTGGTFDYGAVGFSFDLRTGRQLTVLDLLPGWEWDALRDELFSITVNHVRALNGEDAAVNARQMLEYVIAPADVNFYVEPDGLIVLYYSKYAIASGADGTFAIPTGFYARPDRDGTNAPSGWALENVEQAIAAGLVPPVLCDSFTDNITRGDFCTLAAQVYEAMRGPVTDYSRDRFADCYDDPVLKMAQVGVVNGVSARRFAPGATLTREQAATMLARLAKALGQPLNSHSPNFNDYASISGWAADAVGQMQLNGIMNGINDGSDFDPQGPYTREQSMVTILRLVDRVEHPLP